MDEGPVGDDDPERLDTVHHILAGEYRRAVLRYLASTGDDVVTIDSIIEHIVHMEKLANSRETIAIRFHHATLPKLADCGLIEYDQRSATLRYWENEYLEDELDRRATMQADD